MLLKKLRLPFILFLATLPNQIFSLLATTSQPKQEQAVNTQTVDQANKRYRKQVIVGVTCLALHCLNLFFFCKKIHMLDYAGLLFSTGYLFLNCFSYHQHLNSLADTKKAKVYSIFEVVLLIAPIVINATCSIKVLKVNRTLLCNLILLVMPAMYNTLHTIKQYHYQYPQQANKNFLSIIKRCFAGVWLDWMLFIIGLIDSLITKRTLAMRLILSFILPQIYTARESQLLLKNHPLGAGLCSIIELTIGLAGTYLLLQVSVPTASKAVIFASIWAVLKNLVITLLPLIQRYRQRIKYPTNG